MAFALFTAPFAGSSLYGSKPNLPDPGAEYDKALNKNTAILPKAEALATDINQFNSDALMKQLRANIPGYDEMMAKGGGLINSLLAGEVPKDILESIQRSTAFKSFSGGFAGSQAGAGLTARDLGLTSLDLAGKGLDAAMRWIGQAKANTTAPMMDVTSMFMPMDSYFKRDTQQAIIDAAPDPVAVGRFSTEMGYLGMALSMFGGKGYTPKTPSNGMPDNNYLNSGGNPDSGNLSDSSGGGDGFGGDSGGSGFDMGGGDSIGGGFF